jgi:hypothetical protein
MYLLVFILQIVLQVKAIRKGLKKLWISLVLLELISMLAANRIQAYYDSLPGYGIMPGFSYMGEVLLSFFASVLYGACFLISSCIFIVLEEKKKKIIPFYALAVFLFLVVGTWYLGNEFIRNFDKIKCTGTIVGYTDVNMGGTEEQWPLIEFTVDGKQYQDDYPMFEGAELGTEITVYAYPVRATYKCVLSKVNNKFIYIPAFVLCAFFLLVRRKKLYSTYRS